MSAPAELDPRLAGAVDQLEATGSAAEIYDPEWRLVHLTSQFRAFTGNRPEDLGLGLHAVEVRVHTLDGMVPLESGRSWMRLNVPLMAHATPGGLDAILEMLGEERVEALEPLAEREPEALWWGEITYLQPGLPPAQTRYLTFALTDGDGERIGWAIIYLPAAPASIVSLVTRGNQGMFARMAELLHPARHETAILFADIQASSQLARRLSSQRWFELIRDFSTEADHAAISRAGIVGRHAGDGCAPGARSSPGARPASSPPSSGSTRACTGAARSTSGRWSPAAGSRSPRWATRSTSARGSSSPRATGCCSPPSRWSSASIRRTPGRSASTP
jgi:hypothetical protein